MNKFSQYLTQFFTQYLTVQKNCSSNTIMSYRDTFRFFLKYIQDEKNIKIEKFDITDFTKELVIDYLNFVEKKSSINTRNIRRAGIMSFCRYIQYTEPIAIGNVNRILEIPIKKSVSKEVEYLTEYNLKLLLAQPNQKLKKERKDLVIMSVLYDTGARISEFINIKLKDVRFEKPYSIRVVGKGNKIRDIAILENTINLINIYIKENNIENPEEYLFSNSRNEKYTRKGISHKIDKYVNRAVKIKESFPKHIHPHVFRHTKAVIMLNAGIDLFVISQFLGHSNIETSQIYAKITDETKRKILEKAYFETSTNKMDDWLERKDIMDFLNNL